MQRRTSRAVRYWADAWYEKAVQCSTPDSPTSVVLSFYLSFYPYDVTLYSGLWLLHHHYLSRAYMRHPEVVCRSIYAHPPTGHAHPRFSILRLRLRFLFHPRATAQTQLPDSHPVLPVFDDKRHYRQVNAWTLPMHAACTAYTPSVFQRGKHRWEPSLASRTGVLQHWFAI